MSRRGITCPTSASSTTNPTWSDMGSNPGQCGGKPETNSLNYGTVYVFLIKVHSLVYHFTVVLVFTVKQKCSKKKFKVLLKICFLNVYTECGKLTSFFIWIYASNQTVALNLWVLW
jgi:hypothetical protein